MENINKIIEKNTWNFTRSPGGGYFVIVDMYIFIGIAFL